MNGDSNSVIICVAFCKILLAQNVCDPTHYLPYLSEIQEHTAMTDFEFGQLLNCGQWVHSDTSLHPI